MIRNLEVFGQFCKLIKKALPLIEPAIKGAFLPNKITDYPSLQVGKSGFPTISTYSKLVDISSFFRSRYQGAVPELPLHDFPEFKWLVTKLKSTNEYLSYFRLPDKSKEDDKTFPCSRKQFFAAAIFFLSPNAPVSNFRCLPACGPYAK